MPDNNKKCVNRKQAIRTKKTASVADFEGSAPYNAVLLLSLKDQRLIAQQLAFFSDLPPSPAKMYAENAPTP